MFGAVLALAVAALSSGAAGSIVSWTISGFGNEGSAASGRDAATGGVISGAADSKTGTPGFVAPSSSGPDAISGGAAVGDRVDVVRTGNFTLEVSSLDESLAHLTDAVKSAGGYLSASSRYQDTASPYFVVTYRIPAASFDAVLKRVRSEGTVLNEQIDSYEVTMQLVDLEARLKNLRASESALDTLMAKAKSVADVLAVQGQLTQVRGDIESFDAQRAALANQVAMTTLSVQLNLPASPVTDASKGFNVLTELRAALGNLISVARSLAVVIINLVIVALPIALGGALLGGVVARTWEPLLATLRRLFGWRRVTRVARATRTRR